MQNNPYAQFHQPGRKKVGPSNPYEDPYTIEGPDRLPAPQTPIDAAKDAEELARLRATNSALPTQQARDSIALERDRMALEKDRKLAADPTGALGVEQSRATGFYSRGTKANQQYESLGVGAEPFALAVGKMVLPDAAEGYIKSPERQAADANIRAFVSSVLRYESGAAIPPEEFSSAYQTYFPQPGEGPEAVAAKKRLREQALEALSMGAGPGASQVEQQQPDRTQQYTLPPTGGQGIELNNGEMKRVDDPILAGINARINQMFKAREPIGNIARFIQDAGIPIREVMPSLQQAEKFRKQYPNYNGDWNVNIDDKLVPMSGTRSFMADTANSELGAGAVAAGQIVTGGHLDNLVNAAGGNGELANIGIDALRSQYPGSSLAGDVAGGLSLYGLGRGAMGAAGFGGAPATGAFAPSAMGGDAALGAYVNSGSNGTNALDPVAMLKGAGLSVAGGAVGRGVINTAGRAVSPTGGGLAPLYEEGVRPTLGQRMGGAFSRFEEAHTAVPMLGALPRNARNAAIDEAQKGAFNQALREIGEQLPPGVIKGTQAHAYMQRAFNKIYDKARSGMTFQPDADFGKEFGAVLNDVDLLPPASQNTFKQLATQVGARLKARGGALTGDDYKMLSSRVDAKVRAIRKNPNGDGELADALERFSLALDDGARRHSSPEAAALLDAADRGYAKSVIIENAAKGAGAAGEFSGQQLENAIKQGAGGLRARKFLRGDAPMQDYAGAMTKLGDTVPDSGTIPRLLATGGAGTVAATHPSALIPSALSLMTNAPGIKQGLNAALAPNRSGLAPVRRKIMDRAYLGSLFGVPLAIEGQ